MSRSKFFLEINEYICGVSAIVHVHIPVICVVKKARDNRMKGLCQIGLKIDVCFCPNNRTAG